jgi:hypothetical protein
MEYMERIHNKVITILSKWINPNEGATTEELRDLRYALNITLNDLNRAIELREEDENEVPEH